MANRRSNKKLRAMTLLRMAKTGESYQSARTRVLARWGSEPPRVGYGRPSADFVEARYFGAPMILAILPVPLRAPLIVRLTARSARFGHPRSPLWDALRSEGVQ